MANKIQVDLVADLKLALDKLGLGKDVERAFGRNAGLTTAIAKGLGLDIQKVVADSVAAGLQQGAAKAKAFNYASFINQHIGAGQNRPDRKSYADFWKSAVPETVHKGFFASIEQKLMGSHSGGGILGGFGRYEIGQAFAHSIGLGGGVGGRLVGAGLAGIGPKVPGLTVGLAALTVAIDATKLAFRHLIEAAERGAKLYEQGRQLGVGSGKAAAYLQTLGAVGIDESMALRLAAYGQFARGGRGRGMGSGIRGNVSGEMIASGRGAGMTQLEIQQLANMGKEINYAAGQLKTAIMLSSTVAFENFKTTLEWRIFKQDVASFFEGLASLMGPITQSVLALLSSGMKMANIAVLIERKLMGLTSQLASRLAVISPPGIFRALMGTLGLATNVTNGEDPAHKITGFARDSHFSPLEKMGLVIGGHQDKSIDYLKQIAKNTYELARQKAIHSPGAPQAAAITGAYLSNHRLFGGSTPTPVNMP